MTEETVELVNGSLETLNALAGGIFESLAPRFLRELNHEIRDRIAKAPLELNSYGYDPWGLNVDVARRTLLVFALFYKYYFRVKTYGIENLPPGRMLIIGNHAGQIAIDACMIGTATVLEADPPRPLRGMGEYWLPTIPFFNVFMARSGGVVGTPKNCVDILEHGEAVIAFPEGVRGMNKPFSQRYQLQEFGSASCGSRCRPTRRSCRSRWWAPRSRRRRSATSCRSRACSACPRIPLLLNFFPLPVRYHIYFGEPMEFRGNPNDEDEMIMRKVEQVKERINEMIQRRPAAAPELVLLAMARRQKRVFILGGGAALGAHHVGALKYLEEQGIKPDAIVGSSIGVINACCYASGGVAGLEQAWHEFRSLPRIFSPSLRHNPVLGLSLFSMDRLASAIEEHIDFPKIFESRLELEFILLNLSRGRGEVYGKSDCATWRELRTIARAGYAIPAALPPDAVPRRLVRRRRLRLEHAARARHRARRHRDLPARADRERAAVPAAASAPSPTSCSASSTSCGARSATWATSTRAWRTAASTASRSSSSSRASSTAASARCTSSTPIRARTAA